jgi:hypothetical protein
MVRDRLLSFSNVTIKGFPEWTQPAIEIDLSTGNLYQTDCNKTNEGYQIQTEFSAIGSRLFVIPKQSGYISFLEINKKVQFKEISKIKLEQENWNILLNEPNVCVLDIPFYKIGDENWQKEEEILQIDKIIRQKYLEIPPRGGSIVQPWARKKNKNPKAIPVSLKYSFFVEKIPSGECFLAIEKPELFQIYINGYKILSDTESGWWVDKSLRTLRFDPSILKTGKNEIILETMYNENYSGFEIIYILGNFGGKIEEKQVIITKPINSLKIGDWTEQGLPFYSGSVTYNYLIKPELKENQHISISIPEYRGVGIRIIVDGKIVKTIGWPPYQTDITEFVKGKENVSLSIEILGHRRNSHGPLHLNEKWPICTGPFSFWIFPPEGKKWVEIYQIVPCGLIEKPELIITELGI